MPPEHTEASVEETRDIMRRQTRMLLTPWELSMTREWGWHIRTRSGDLIALVISPVVGGAIIDAHHAKLSAMQAEAEVEVEYISLLRDEVPNTPDAAGEDDFKGLEEPAPGNEG